MPGPPICYPEAQWVTASPFGVIQGAANIQAFIDTQLPPRQFGPQYARHRMASAADQDDLTVLAPNGERARFTLELAELPALPEGRGTRTVIRRLVREVVSNVLLNQ